MALLLVFAWVPGNCVRQDTKYRSGPDWAQALTKPYLEAGNVELLNCWGKKKHGLCLMKVNATTAPAQQIMSTRHSYTKFQLPSKCCSQKTKVLPKEVGIPLFCIFALRNSQNKKKRTQVAAAFSIFCRLHTYICSPLTVSLLQARPRSAIVHEILQFD